MEAGSRVEAQGGAIDQGRCRRRLSKPRRAGLYLRVSTDDQSTALQRRELIQACKHRDWTVTEVYEDAGASGAKGREGRPAFDRLCQDATRRRLM
jgi:DNA invertase Pin-like site-specific DNA recombinase